MIKKWKKSKEIGIISVIILISMIIALKNNAFLRVDNIFDLLKWSSVLGIMA